jgi:hypothetical protein
VQKFDSDTDDGKAALVLNDLIPYWIDRTRSIAVPNSVTMNSLHLLTGPNGGGKSSILRSIGAAALLGICGLMVPAASAVIPWLDAVMVRMMPLDSPADGKSSFQVWRFLQQFMCFIFSCMFLIILRRSADGNVGIADDSPGSNREKSDIDR